MGLLRFFRKKKSDLELLQENPTFQTLNELYATMNIMCEAGVDADELPNGVGEYGITPSNPIPCRTITGSTAYLNQLRATDGARVTYERIGSVTSGVTPYPVDAYRIYSLSGENLATLYLSPYQKRVSAKPPTGFTLAGQAYRRRV